MNDQALNRFNLRKDFLTYFEDGNLFLAIEKGEKLVRLYDSNFDEYEYSTDLYNLASAYQKLGRINNAKKIYRQIIRIVDTKEFNPQDKESMRNLEMLIDTENAIGVCNAKGNSVRFKTILKTFEKTLDLIQMYIPHNKDKLADNLHNLGCAHYDLKEYNQAIYYHLQELALRSEKDINFIDTLNFLGYDYEGLKDYENAIKYLNEAIEIIKGLYGINSLEYFTNIFYLGKVYMKDNNFEKAAICYEKACNLIETKFGEKYIYFADVLGNLSDVYIKLNRLKDAIVIQIKAVKFLRNTVGEKHIYYANNAKKLADIYSLNSDFDKALDYYEKDSNIKREMLGSQNEEYIKSLLNIMNIKVIVNNPDYLNIQEEILNILKEKDDLKLYTKTILSIIKIYIENNVQEQVFYLYNFLIDNVNQDELHEEMNFSSKLFLNEHIEEDIFKKIKDFLKNLDEDSKDYL